MKNKFSVFGLTIEQTEVLFALQRKIIVNDILKEGTKCPLVGSNKRVQKQLWLDTWDSSILNYLKSHGNNSATINISNLDLKINITNLDKDSQNKVWKFMVFLECVLYLPYYPLSNNKDDFKLFKGLQIDKVEKQKTLEKIADILEIDHKYIKVFQKSYTSAIKKLSGYWTKVAVSAGIGVIVVLIAILTFQYEIIAFFAANGLSGAAAISAGLAALGGGAISAGGFGITGGIAVLIGGGSLLGASAGTAIGTSIASLGSTTVLSEAAKLQVVLKEIVLAIQKDTAYFQEIILNINQQISRLKSEIIRLKTTIGNNKKEIKNLEDSVKILEKLVKDAL